MKTTDHISGPFAVYYNAKETEKCHALKHHHVAIAADLTVDSAAETHPNPFANFAAHAGRGS